MKINGKAARLMVDTGATMCVLHAHVSERFGHAPKGTGEPFKLNGGAPAELLQQVRAALSVGSITVGAMEFYIFSAPTVVGTLDADTPVPCDGLLGASFLHAHSAVIDYATGLLHLRDPVEAESAIQGRWVCVAREINGETLVGERVSHIRLRIRRQEATFEVRDKDFPYRLVIDPSASPKRMELVETDGFTRPVIYRIVDGKLTIAAALFELRHRVGSRPTEFRSVPGGAVSVMTFEKEP